MQTPTSFRAKPISLDVQRMMGGIKECGWGTGSCLHFPMSPSLLLMHKGICAAISPQVSCTLLAETYASSAL